MILVPFDTKTAEKISANDIEGRIVTRNGQHVRIVCWDIKSSYYPIGAMVLNHDGEIFRSYTSMGEFNCGNRDEFDLMLELPEYLTFEEGDIIYGEVDNGGGDYCKWLSIVKEVGCIQGKPYVASYVDYIWDSSYKCGSIEYMAYSDNFDLIRLATEEEKARFAKRLQENKSPVSDEYLEKYFGIKDYPKVSNSEKFGKKEELLREAVHQHYGCDGKYPCEERAYCRFCEGMNDANDCSDECFAEEFAEGFGVGWNACLKYLYTMTKEQAINKIKNYCKRKKELIMKYAEVRKAAEGYCDNEWKKEIDLQVRNCIDKLTIPAFIEGANWRVNASWHGAKETPQERRFCLYILKDGSYGCGYYHKRDNTIWYEQFKNVEKWAYFDDLIPFLED